MTTPRLLLLDHAPIFGGAESFLLDLVGNLDQARFSPIIVTASNSPVLKKFRATGFPTFTTPLPQLNRQPLLLFRLWQAGAQLARLAKKQKVTLIHSFTARTHLIGAITSRLSGIPLVWRLGDDTLPQPVLQIFASTPKQIVGVSHWLTTQYPRLHFHGLVPDGAAPALPITQQEARRELGLPQEAIIIAHTGRLVRWKGQKIFIQALNQLKTQFPQMHGLIVGAWHAEDEQAGPLGGGENYYHELQTLVNSYNLNNQITFAGFIRHAGLAYAAADIMVHSSILPEPFGRVVIEAMMAGCPVVAAHAGALPEIIIHGESGLLTPPNDATALADTLTQLITSAKLRHHLSIQGQRRAESQFSLKLMVERMQNVYTTALQ